MLLRLATLSEALEERTRARTEPADDALARPVPGARCGA
jgi:hypothetical protein